MELFKLKEYEKRLEGEADSQSMDDGVETKEVESFEQRSLKAILKKIGVARGVDGGKELIVDMKLEGSQTLGYVFVGGDGRIYLNPSLFEMDSEEVEHVVIHERRHLENGVGEVPLCEEPFSVDHFKVLNNFMKLEVSMEAVDLVEGFNEFGTEEDAASNMRGVYDVEVQVARKLDSLARDVLGVSLLRFFNQGDVRDLVKLLKVLADRLLLEKVLTRVRCEESFEERFGKMIDDGEFDEVEIKDLDHAYRVAEDGLQIMILEDRLEKIKNSPA